MHILLSVLVFADARSAAKDFAADAKVLYRAAACGQSAGDPSTDKPAENKPQGQSASAEAVGIDKAIAEKHCAALKPLIDTYAEFWKTNIEPTLAKYVPREQAKTVVYPFGGGDSVTALGTYPNVTDLTSLSLELVGDPRVSKVPPQQMQSELAAIRKNLELLFRVKHSKTDNMNMMTRGGIPGQLVFALVAEVVRGYEPVGLRYFAVAPDGTLDWLTDAEVTDADEQLAQKKMTDRQHAQVFSNMEIEFKRPGESFTRLYRHIAANLDNEHLAQDAGALKYLESKGQVFAITKAASYLLWWDHFSQVRDYLVNHMEYMISDSTGVPPDVAQQKGFKQYTFGDFDGPWLGDANSRVANLFRTMWRKQPKRPIDFRYGYPDSSKNAHMLITTKLAIAGLE